MRFYYKKITSFLIFCLSLTFYSFSDENSVIKIKYDVNTKTKDSENQNYISFDENLISDICIQSNNLKYFDNVTDIKFINNSDESIKIIVNKGNNYWDNKLKYSNDLIKIDIFASKNNKNYFKEFKYDSVLNCFVGLNKKIYLENTFDFDNHVYEQNIYNYYFYDDKKNELIMYNQLQTGYLDPNKKISIKKLKNQQYLINVYKINIYDTWDYDYNVLIDFSNYKNNNLKFNMINYVSLELISSKLGDIFIPFLLFDYFN